MLATAMAQDDGEVCPSECECYTERGNRLFVLDCIETMETFPVTTGNLVEITISGTQLTSIPASPFALQNHARLENINIYDNPLLTVIEPNAFSGTVASSIWLTNNALTTLPPGLFKDLVSLDSLDPNENYVQLQGNLFEHRAPPSTYGSPSDPFKCHSSCSTCSGFGPGACCSDNCLYCTTGSECTECYNGYILADGACVPPFGFSSSPNVASTLSPNVATSSVLLLSSQIVFPSVVPSASTSSNGGVSVSAVTSSHPTQPSSALIASPASTTPLISASSTASSASTFTAIGSSSTAPAPATSSAFTQSASIVAAAPSSEPPTSSGTTSSASSSSSAPIQQSPQTDAASSAVPAIIGAVVGVLVLLALIALLAVRRRRQHQAQAIADRANKLELASLQKNNLATQADSSYTDFYRATPAPEPTYATYAPTSASEPTYATYAPTSTAEPTYATYAASFDADQNYATVNAAEYDAPVQQSSPMYESTAASNRIYQSSAAVTQTLRQGLVLGEKLGSGAFGVVFGGRLPRALVPMDARYLLHDPAQSHLDLAVKTIAEDATEQSRDDFVEEAGMVAQFDNPNVVRAIATLLEVEPYLCLLELMPYGDLRSVLEKSKLAHVVWSKSEFAHALAQVASGLKYLESIRFVHRDIAARNCLVGRGLSVKISDFGLTRSLAENDDYYRMEHRGRLPVKWMAPECLNYRTFTHQSDVWAFGVLAWEAFSYGATPYGSIPVRDVLARVEAGLRLERPEDCSADLFAQVQSCWELDPLARPRFALLSAYFTHLSAGQPIRDIGALTRPDERENMVLSSSAPVSAQSNV
ncbi:TKL protein kinase [Capsaspora owczarzaki ATCC 30864]|uniref:TKL protein kinase n=2 Tax=Capsaspora owczarzaki (strain ATCC 30864) TaxID=595528 RepID=A0A0D2UJF4_CAPO3|nr:TKL protein kinase [Capsaspora owczarzaki ATCC 30864]